MSTTQEPFPCGASGGRAPDNRRSGRCPQAVFTARKAPDEDVLGDRVVRVHLARAWTVGALGTTVRVVAACVLAGGGAGAMMSNPVPWRQGNPTAWCPWASRPPPRIS